MVYQRGKGKAKKVYMKMKTSSNARWCRSQRGTRGFRRASKRAAGMVMVKGVER